MKPPSAAAIRDLILERTAEQLAARGLTPSDVPPDFDLLLEGLIDSAHQRECAEFTATISQLAASHPLENPQRPETRKPSGTGSALPPAGFRPLEKRVSGPSAKNSSCARSGKWPSHQLCTVQSE